MGKAEISLFLFDVLILVISAKLQSVPHFGKITTPLIPPLKQQVNGDNTECYRS